MEKDQFLQHDVTARSNAHIMMLIEVYGMEGYGAYWALMEHLRIQVGYSSPVSLLKTLSRQFHISLKKLTRIVEDFGLFCIENNQFSSNGLKKRMKQLDDKRERFVEWGRRGAEAKALKNRDEVPSLPPAIMDKLSTDKLSVDKSSSVEDLQAVAVAGYVSGKGEREVPPDWETYIDRLQDEQVWMETAAIHSGLGRRFIEEFPVIAMFFKQHVCSQGKEGHITSLEDAKSYLYNLVSSNTPARGRLLACLDSHKAENAYRYEQRDKEGKRCYCGGIIPVGAPPRPNERSYWDDELKQWI